VIPLAARPRLTHARLRRRGDEVLLLAPERGLRLRGSAAEILALVDGERTVAEIVDQLAHDHAAAAPEPGAIRRDVLALFDALARRRLLWIER
jgi:coenzyme PQQ biosynthesis protein PqqD